MPLLLLLLSLFSVVLFVFVVVFVVVVVELLAANVCVGSLFMLTTRARCRGLARGRTSGWKVKRKNIVSSSGGVVPLWCRYNMRHPTIPALKRQPTLFRTLPYW